MVTPLILILSTIILELLKANNTALKITPITTPYAKLSVNTTIATVDNITKVSAIGISFILLIDCQSIVVSDTTIITDAKATTGT